MRSPEIPNIITVLAESSLKETSFVHFLEHWENQFFTYLVVITLSFIVIKASRSYKMIPGKLQNLIEMFVEKFRDLVYGILGEKHGRHYLPYVGSLFVFIFFNNILGIIPLMKAATSSYKTTVGLAILTFLYVQYTGIRKNGLFGYLYHLIGSPKTLTEYMMTPLLATLHIIGELAKPLSLSLRLFGNILGEDLLLGVFAGLGIAIWSATGINIPMGLPLHFPFLFLAILTSTIQALVFSLLTTIYLSLVLPHEEHE